MKIELLTLFTNLIREEYTKMKIPFSEGNLSVSMVNPLIALNGEQETILNEGDGQTPYQYKQINSSTGLAVNYYKIYESQQTISDLIFENKVARPLNKGGKCANLDVSYRKDGVLYFIESKFLEPYYDGNETIKEAYFDASKYSKEVKIRGQEHEWIELFKKTNALKYYNITQLCRHLLAIYRYTHGMIGSAYKGEPVVLQSVIWKMPQKFLDRLDDNNRSEMEIRNHTLQQEAKTCDGILNSFIAKIGWKNMRFENLHYNEILNEIKNSTHYNEFCKRFFLS